MCACAIARAVGKPRDWQQRRRASYLAPSLLGSIASRGDSIALTQVEMESSNQQDTDNSATSQGAAASGGGGLYGGAVGRDQRGCTRSVGQGPLKGPTRQWGWEQHGTRRQQQKEW